MISGLNLATMISAMIAISEDDMSENKDAGIAAGQKDRVAYYVARAEFLEALLKSDLTPRQRRQAEFELTSARVKSYKSKEI